MRDSERRSVDDGPDQTQATPLPDERHGVTSPRNPVIQAKLAVGRADDPHEREAETVARRVVDAIERNHHHADPADESVADGSPAPTIRRRVQPGAAASVGPEGGEVDPATESRIRAGAGRPLAPEVRRQMEAGFGADFSAVRIHPRSSVAPELGARAFTSGRDVHFAPGEFDPASRGGRELLAHELTHVVQQNGAGTAPVSRAPIIRRKVAGGTVGDRVVHDDGGMFTVAGVEGEGSEALYTLTPDSGSDPVRVFGDVKTYNLTSTTKATSGGITGITLDVTFGVSRTKCDGLQAVQVWWGSKSTIGVGVGKMKFSEGDTDYEAFVDGGMNSPWVTLSGEAPAHATKPYYLTADEVASQVTWDGENGTIRVYDQPTAVVHFDAMNFETAIVAVNHDGKGTDKVLKVFTWGWHAQGTDPNNKSGDEIAGKDSGIKSASSVSATWRSIVANDYPDYKYE